MADRIDELRGTAAQCLALAQATTDPKTRTALIVMAQKLYDMASGRPGDFESAQREFNDRQMLPRLVRQTTPQPTMQQQQQIQSKKEK
jgi:hypothetical protein